MGDLVRGGAGACAEGLFHGHGSPQAIQHRRGDEAPEGLSLSVRWTPEAETSFRAISDFLAKEWGVRVADAFASDVVETVALLEEFPMAVSWNCLISASGAFRASIPL